MFEDVLYWGETKKQRKRRKLEEARRKGRAGEEAYKFGAMLRGAEVERTGRGHDSLVEMGEHLVGGPRHRISASTVWG